MTEPPLATMTPTSRCGLPGGTTVTVRPSWMEIASPIMMSRRAALAAAVDEVDPTIDAVAGSRSANRCSAAWSAR